MVLYRNGQIGGAGALAAISLALTVSKSLKVVVLYGLIRRQIGRIDYGKALSFAGRLGLATAAMGLTVYFIGNALEAPLLAWTPPFMAQKLRSLALFGAVGLGGGMVFLVVAALTRIEELTMVGGFVVRKVRGRLAR
jgi:peptidoglycan biosynthesis protein MviN/MurJ (putative lipid II flippase)